MKQETFEAVRSANQNGLKEYLNDYNQYELFTTAEMLEKWIVNFVNANSLNYKELNIGFVKLETDPPLYLVTIEGYKDQYAVLTKDAYVRYTSGTLIVSD